MSAWSGGNPFQPLLWGQNTVYNTISNTGNRVKALKLTVALKDKPNRSRSLKGHPCNFCRQSHCHCEKVFPSCNRCLQNGKKCEYPIELKWGGRPYKKPKIGKLNKVANISAQ